MTIQNAADNYKHMIEIKTLENFTYPEKPRRIMKYVLVYCATGGLSMTIDENKFKLRDGQVVTITSGQIHSIKKSSNTKAFILEFTLDFFCKNDNDIELIFHNGLFCHFAMNEVITVNKSIIESQLNAISVEIIKQPYQYLISIHSRIELILVEINRAKVKRGDEIWKPGALFLKFEPGATYPYHNHPGGEEIFVLRGEAIIENVTLSEGDYLYTPANFKHSVSTKKGCTMLFVIPEEVEIL